MDGSPVSPMIIVSAAADGCAAAVVAANVESFNLWFAAAMSFDCPNVQKRKLQDKKYAKILLVDSSTHRA